jgi:uncharacterized protein YneF (UPF0154 family)
MCRSEGLVEWMIVPWKTWVCVWVDDMMGRAVSKRSWIWLVVLLVVLASGAGLGVYTWRGLRMWTEMIKEEPFVGQEEMVRCVRVCWRRDGLG